MLSMRWVTRKPPKMLTLASVSATSPKILARACPDRSARSLASTATAVVDPGVTVVVTADRGLRARLPEGTIAMSPSAVRRVAEEAARQPRLGARALKEVFRRVIRDYEFDPPQAASGSKRTLLIDRPEVERALQQASAPAYAAKR